RLPTLSAIFITLSSLSSSPSPYTTPFRSCLLPIATRTRTSLIDPLAVGALKPIIDVLSGPVPVKVIHNARFERRVLATLGIALRSEEHTSELQSLENLVCRLLLEKQKTLS